MSFEHVIAYHCAVTPHNLCLPVTGPQTPLLFSINIYFANELRREQRITRIVPHCTMDESDGL